MSRCQESFTCPRCLLTSYNPHDARELYCGGCHELMDRSLTPAEAAIARLARQTVRRGWDPGRMVTLLLEALKRPSAYGGRRE